MSGDPAPILVDCERCDGQHDAEYSHEGRFGEGPIFAAICPTDDLTVWHTAEAEVPARHTTRTADDLGIDLGDTDD